MISLRRTSRLVSLVTAILLCAPLVAGCGAQAPAAPPAAPKSEPARPAAAPAAQAPARPAEAAKPAAKADDLSGSMTVSVEDWMVEKYNMKELIDRFQQAHPGVTVKLLTHQGLGANYLNIFLEWEKTKAATADLYFGGLPSQISPAMIDDQLEPWDDMMVGELAPDKWIKGFLDGAHVPGPAGSNYPTLPGLGETMSFQVNTKHLATIDKLDASGKPIMPKSYEEIADYACKIAQTPIEGKTITGLEMEYGINFAPDTWMTAVIAAEGTYLRPDGTVNWDSKAGKDWIAFQKSILDKKCGGNKTFTDNNGARNGQKAGQIAIINASNSRSTENNAVLGKDVVQMFGYPGSGGTLAFSHQIYVPKVAKEKKLARAFAREAILGQFGQTWSATNFGKMPTLWANYDALPQDDPNFAVVRKELSGPTRPQWTFRDGQALRQAYVDELQKHLTGGQSVDEMIGRLNDAQKTLDLTVPGKR
jgi:multiple sugar transport system substrate-binding protein